MTGISPAQMPSTWATPNASPKATATGAAGSTPGRIPAMSPTNGAINPSAASAPRPSIPYSIPYSPPGAISTIPAKALSSPPAGFHPATNAGFPHGQGQAPIPVNGNPNGFNPYRAAQAPNSPPGMPRGKAASPTPTRPQTGTSPQTIPREVLEKRLPVKAFPKRPKFSLTPDRIRWNPNRESYESMVEQIHNMPWDYSNHIDPFGSH